MLRLRLATENDIQDVYDFSMALEEETGILSPINESKFIQQYSNILRTPKDNIIILVEDDQEVIGCCIGVTYSPMYSDLRIASEILLYVFPDKRGLPSKMLYKAYRYWAKNLAKVNVIRRTKMIKSNRKNKTREEVVSEWV